MATIHVIAATPEIEKVVQDPNITRDSFERLIQSKPIIKAYENIYTIEYKERLEEDVQQFFITGLSISDGTIHVTCERSKSFSVSRKK